ncbi:hypothetical protein IHE49_03690 [Rhodanobacter sp. 7MK24]|uniref:hypothetical protein n=1 Tax=Rhodanobacter sp. 7MK24 TaxID=2775922 RepID=UPI0017857899|nr:hypothetical protein [Rhodanobacter sp. 7MK24]MBD8879580.1 hypothetical protein [Rhodanobacter sp. 7MK24]
MSDALRTLIEALERDDALAEPTRLRERIEALDRLDAWMPVAGKWMPRAQAIQRKLEAANATEYEAVRLAIRQGRGREAMRHRWRDGDGAASVRGDAYDWLDEWVAGVLPHGTPAEAEALPPEMVFYQPTPARHVFDLLDRLQLGEHDTLVDLGAGLGHVPLLAAICSDARGLGIEIEHAYVESTRRCARDLHLANAHFVRGDAREADFGIGSVFYLYTPFTGTILREVLDALRCEAARRTFRVCSFGPCTAVLAAESWLAADDEPRSDRVAIFRAQRPSSPR